MTVASAAPSTSAIIRISVPMMVYSLVMSMANMFINSNVNTYGVMASAVGGIGSKINMIVIGWQSGLAQSTQNSAYAVITVYKNDT